MDIKSYIKQSLRGFYLKAKDIFASVERVDDLDSSIGELGNRIDSIEYNVATIPQIDELFNGGGGGGSGSNVK